MKVIAYTYDADVHCPACTRKALARGTITAAPIWNIEPPAAIAASYRQIQWVAEHGALDHSGAAAACIRDQITLSAHMALIDDEAHAAMLAALAEAEGTNFL